MTRQIKFRLWDKKQNKIILLPEMMTDSEYNVLRFGQGLDDYHQLDTTYNKADIDKSWQRSFEEAYVVMQYTGLKDKNGVEIYESDVVELVHVHPKATQKKLKRCVVWDSGKARFSFNGLPFGGKKIEVIGNIYQNPELLEDNDN